MMLVIGTSGTAPRIYQPRGANGNADPTLYGRPVIAIEQAPTLGTVGDIVLGDFGEYCIVEGPLQGAISADVGFVSDQIVWRFTLRVDGKPLWGSAITPYNGGSTRSPFVSLAAR
jgi:HK97 family phage major capsid protein